MTSKRLSREEVEKLSYCPIRLENLDCIATNELCDRTDCINRIRSNPPERYQEKYNHWIEHRRGDKRIKHKRRLQNEQENNCGYD